jgi:hypothetical protein
MLDTGSHDNLRLKPDHHRSDSMVLLQRSDTTSTTAIGSEEELLAREEHPDIVRQLTGKGEKEKLLFLILLSLVLEWKCFGKGEY